MFRETVQMLVYTILHPCGLRPCNEGRFLIAAGDIRFISINIKIYQQKICKYVQIDTDNDKLNGIGDVIIWSKRDAYNKHRITKKCL